MKWIIALGIIIVWFLIIGIILLLFKGVHEINKKSDEREKNEKL